MSYRQLVLEVKDNQGDTFGDTYQLNLSLSYVYCLATSYHYSLWEKMQPFQYVLHSGWVVQAALSDWVTCLALIAFVINTLALYAISSDSTTRIIFRTMEIVCKIRLRCYIQVQSRSKLKVQWQNMQQSFCRGPVAQAVYYYLLCGWTVIYKLQCLYMLVSSFLLTSCKHWNLYMWLCLFGAL